MTIIISCASDTELAKRLYDHLIEIARINFNYATDLISYNADEIEIWDRETRMKKDDIVKAVKVFLASDSHLGDHSVIEFGNIITVGIKQSLDNIILTCEMCGFIAVHEDELSAHRVTHGFL